jgi:hypothetical protein
MSSPIWLARSSIECWPSKCGVVKNGEAGSCTIACLSAMVATQKTITSRGRSPVFGIGRVSARRAEKTNDVRRRRTTCRPHLMDPVAP